jgi:hypothetical protein
MKRISIGTSCVTKIFGVFLGLLIPLSAFSNNEWFDAYNNTRSKSMGGASVALTSDETSLYRNAANLGSIRESYGTLIDPEFEGSSKFLSQVTSKSTGKVFEVSEIMSILGSNLGQYYHAKAQLTPSLIKRNIGIGLLYRNEVSAEMNATGTNLDLRYQSDIGAVLGINFRLFDGRIKVGGSVKAFSRIEVVNAALPVAGPTDLATIGSEGLAYSFDGGILFQAPWTYIPTLGVVVKDIGGTKFDKQDGLRLKANSRPATVPQSVDAAISIFPIYGNGLRSVWTLEYSDVTNSRNDTDNAKRVHAGIEINARDLFFFRVGYNQRYWTAGFEISAEKFQWQVGSYGEEIGTEQAPREDRRLSTKISLRF